MTIQEPLSTKEEPKGPIFKKSLARNIAAALLFFAMIPVSIMGLVGYLRARFLLEEQTARQIHSTVHNQVEAFDTLMGTKEIRLERISQLSGFQNAANILIDTSSASYEERLLKEFELGNKPRGERLFDSFFLLNPEGVIYAGSNSAWMGTEISSSLLLERVAKKEGSVGIYDLDALFPQEFVLFTISPLSSQSGKDLGVLVGVTEEEATKDFLAESTRYNADTTAYIISSTGLYIGIDPYTEDLTPFTPTDNQQKEIDSFSADFTAEDEEETYLLEFENNFNIAVIAQTHNFASNNSKVVLELPREVAFGQLGNLGPFTIFLFLSTLLVLGTVLLYASRRIVTPLQELSRTARHFARGDWLRRAPVTRSDEIGELEYSFNQMASELNTLYRSLRHQVDERTEYIRTASDVAQSIVATFNLDELLEKTARLIAEQLDYYHVGIFMVGQTGKTAYLKAAHGPSAKEMLSIEHRLDVGSSSIVGWVSANNQHRAASDVGDDPVHFKNELLPDTHAEVGIPIAIGDTVLGVLDVQSIHSEAFDEATIAVLITLSNQIATAIQNASLFESSDVNLHELDRLYRASQEIAQEKTRSGVFEATGRILQGSPFSTVLFTPNDKGIGIYTASDPDYDVVRFGLPEFIDTPPAAIAETIRNEADILDLSKSTSFSKAFIDIPRKMGLQAISLLPIMRDKRLEALVLIGARHKEHLTFTAVQPYTNLLEIIMITLDKIQASEITEKRLAEMEAISITNQATAAVQDLDSLYPVLHEQARQILGEFPFIIALYDEISDAIHIPYVYEDGEVTSIPSFPLGEGLTSIIVHTGQPLMIVENTEERAAALGAKIVGSSAKSWLGSPLKIKGKVIGAIIIQDTENEKSFDQNSLRFINTLASQVSGAIYNIQLLDDSRRRALQLESAAEIARDMSGSLNLDELLSNAVTLIRDRFSFYHASVFLIDTLGEYAIIREATGEAGAQLKRNGHKLGVGSKSIVGYVSNHGEHLV
ncbi:MAG: GAF domain-containing protein, partial [Anaerolineae bacterium]|nr:GAF domain-containing protein [Anaerolineae bacterium]